MPAAAGGGRHYYSYMHTLFILMYILICVYVTHSFIHTPFEKIATSDVALCFTGQCDGITHIVDDEDLIKLNYYILE